MTRHYNVAFPSIKSSNKTVFQWQKVCGPGNERNQSESNEITRGKETSIYIVTNNHIYFHILEDNLLG